MADGGINLGETVGGGGLLLAIGAGLMKTFDAWLKTRRTPDQKARDRFDLDRLVVETAGDLMTGMREDLDALRDEVRQLKSSHAECEERCTALTGEVRALQAVKGSAGRLRAKLKDPAATKPGGSVEGAIFELKDGDITDVSGRPLIKETDR